MDGCRVADAVVGDDERVRRLDDADGTELDRPVVRTDTEMTSPEDSARVARVVREALKYQKCKRGY